MCLSRPLKAGEEAGIRNFVVSPGEGLPRARESEPFLLDFPLLRVALSWSA